MSTSDLASEVTTVIDDIDEIARLIKVALVLQRHPQFCLGEDPLEGVVENDLMYKVSWLGYDLLSRKERLVRMLDRLPPTDDEMKVPVRLSSEGLRDRGHPQVR